MLFKLPNFQHIEFLNSNSAEHFKGLKEFKKSLELGYFSKVTLKNDGNSNQKLDLILEFDCALSLVDILAHFNKGLWGSNDIDKSILLKSFDLLINQNNHLNIDIQELTLYLKDTNIVVKNIYRHSIPRHFNEIIEEIAKQYVSLTKGLTEKPEEIYVPVFEEDSMEYGCISENEAIKKPSSYNEYWGIYSDSEVEGSIFDVQNNKFISANLDCYFSDENN